MQIQNQFTQNLGIRFPMIMAPMFLVSNFEMMEAAMQAGIMGTFPSLNFRKEGELEELIVRLHKSKAEQQLPGNFGVNLIVQKSNPLYAKHLEICVKNKVPFYITSLGNPKEVIARAHAYGAKVFCDVTNIAHAQKCADMGCDGFIAVGQAAGGHAGPNSLQVLIPSLHQHFPNLPVIAAGGLANGAGILSALALGAQGVSVGTRFIASTEAKVNAAYKEAIVNSKMDDIVMTTKISGTPCTIINTPYAKKIGYTQNWFERLLANNKTTKKYFKMLVQIRGMQKLERSVKPANYDTLWCAGQSVELIHDILPCSQIIQRLVEETQAALLSLNQAVKV